jgi:hypothetical protein
MHGTKKTQANIEHDLLCAQTRIPSTGNAMLDSFLSVTYLVLFTITTYIPSKDECDVRRSLFTAGFGSRTLGLRVRVWLLLSS